MVKMGESYLKRKVFNKIGRLRTQASLSSGQTTTSIDSIWSYQMPRNSLSSPQLGSTMRTTSRPAFHLRGSLSSLECTEEVESNNIAPRDPAKMSSSGAGETKRLREKIVPSVSKLKAASRAILFFRRANPSTSTLKRSHHDDANRKPSSARQAAPETGGGQAGVSGAAIIGSQASQHVHAMENNNNKVPQFIVPKLNALKLPLVCLIKSLDGELIREVFVHRYEQGQYLIESLKVSVGINDCKYFGLKMAKSFEDQEDLQNAWLDLNESVCKQIKNKPHLIRQTSVGGGSSSNNSLGAASSTQQAATFAPNQRSVDFYLRIKYYPPNLARVQDPFLRDYLWIQLRRDLRLGKLTSSMNNLTLLMACVLQHELGDHTEELAEKIPEMSILPNQDLIEEQAIELWSRRLVGHKKHQAQMQFLRAAVILETYGFDYYPVRDHQRQRAYLLGFNYAGIKTIRNGRIVHHFSWHSLSKISYERRMIIFHIYPTENSKRKQILGFKCLSNEDCQSLYMRLLEQKYFFTVDLAYFDKSVRRPTCLYTTPASQAVSNDWSFNELTADEQTQSATSCDSRFTSRGASSEEPHDGNYTSHHNRANNTSANSLDEESQISSRYTCDQRVQPEASSSGQARNFPANEAYQSANYSAPSVYPDEETKRWTQPGAAAAANSNTSLRRTQWHRHRANPRQFPSDNDDTTPGHNSSAPDEAEMSEATDSSGGTFEKSPIAMDQRLWTKVMTCIRNEKLQVSRANASLAQRFTELAESVLVQPLVAVQGIFRNNYTCQHLNETSGHANGLRSMLLANGAHGSFRMLLTPALKFCLAIMVINFVIRWTDSLSSLLIEWLT